MNSEECSPVVERSTSDRVMHLSSNPCTAVEGPACWIHSFFNKLKENENTLQLIHIRLYSDEYNAKINVSNSMFRL